MIDSSHAPTPATAL